MDETNQKESSLSTATVDTDSIHAERSGDPPGRSLAMTAEPVGVPVQEGHGGRGHVAADVDEYDGDGAGEFDEGDDGPEPLEGTASANGSFPEPSRRKKRRRRRRGKGPALVGQASGIPAASPASPDAAAPVPYPVSEHESPAPYSHGGYAGSRRFRGRPRPEPSQSFTQTAPRIQARGILKLNGDHSGTLVSPETYFAERSDPFVPRHLVEQEDLEDGLALEVEAVPRGGKGPLVQRVLSVEGLLPEAYRSKYIQFHKGISIDPERRLRMETVPGEISGRVLDVVVPIGRGQRCLIVAPPKAGKTMLLKTMANAIAQNDPDVKIFVLLVDERPEEVTDMQRSVKGEVIASPTDMNATHHVAVSELTFERAKRLVEIGKDVVIFCDSITRMSRAYNSEQRGSGRILSGGIDARTMEKPRRFFGGARCHEGGGSLTIIATCLIDTGSRMDDVIFEEFKGTGNCEIILDRGLFEKRIFPCINVPASGTRKEEKLYDADELPKIHKLRRALTSVKPVDAMELLLTKLTKTRTNRDFLKSIL